MHVTDYESMWHVVFGLYFTIDRVHGPAPHLLAYVTLPGPPASMQRAYRNRSLSAEPIAYCTCADAPRTWSKSLDLEAPIRAGLRSLVLRSRTGLESFVVLQGRVRSSMARIR